jgi:imidazolonepropionase
MSQIVDLLIVNASQLCCVPAINGGPQRGTALGTLGIIENGALAVQDGRILEVGLTPELEQKYKGSTEIDARDRAVVPGFVDPHTHLVWAGERAAEFEMRIAGATYMEIMNAGGGINNTVNQVRNASAKRLFYETRARLDRMLRLGTTTAEIKTGYGLNTETELKQLEVIYQLQEEHDLDIAATFLGAHAVPPEYKGRTDDYVDLIVEEMIPAVVDFAKKHNQPLPFIDVFCEQGVFDVAQSHRILEAGQTFGMPLKIHADEFAGLGGTRLAVELGAASADHLVSTPDEDIQALGQGNTVAVALPPTPFGLGHHEFTPARKIIDAGGILALATDCNPGTAWCESMQFVMALGCRYLKITPAEALAAATINAAYAIGTGNEVGSLEAGKKADLLILDAPDYRHMAYRFGDNLVNIVVKTGKVVVQRGDVISLPIPRKRKQ